jgi:hypothetical protein
MQRQVSRIESLNVIAGWFLLDGESQFLASAVADYVHGGQIITGERMSIQMVAGRKLGLIRVVNCKINPLPDR